MGKKAAEEEVEEKNTLLPLHPPPPTLTLTKKRRRPFTTRAGRDIRPPGTNGMKATLGFIEGKSPLFLLLLSLENVQGTDWPL